jgi:hypothetical protein
MAAPSRDSIHFGNPFESHQSAAKKNPGGTAGI